MVQDIIQEAKIIQKEYEKMYEKYNMQFYSDSMKDMENIINELKDQYSNQNFS